MGLRVGTRGGITQEGFLEASGWEMMCKKALEEKNMGVWGGAGLV